MAKNNKQQEKLNALNVLEVMSKMNKLFQNFCSFIHLHEPGACRTTPTLSNLHGYYWQVFCQAG